MLDTGISSSAPNACAIVAALRSVHSFVYARFLELGRSNQSGNAFVSLGMWGRSRKFVVEYGGSNFAFEYGDMAMLHYSRSQRIEQLEGLSR